MGRRVMKGLSMMIMIRGTTTMILGTRSGRVRFRGESMGMRRGLGEPSRCRLAWWRRQGGRYRSRRRGGPNPDNVRVRSRARIRRGGTGAGDAKIPEGSKMRATKSAQMIVLVAGSKKLFVSGAPSERASMKTESVEDCEPSYGIRSTLLRTFCSASQIRGVDRTGFDR